MDTVKETIQSVNQDVTTSSQSGTEPPSGVTGAGTADKPYDQGNEPAQETASDKEPISGQQGKGTEDEPYDQGNQPEQPEGKTTTELPIHPSPKDPLASPSTPHQGSGNPQSESTSEQQKVTSESRGRDESVQHTTSTPQPTQQSSGTAATGGAFAGAGKEATRLKYEERDVSPGEMRDGTHAVTSGEKGETYTPGKLNKLKDKFHFGRDRN